MNTQNAASSPPQALMLRIVKVALKILVVLVATVVIVLLGGLVWLSSQVPEQVTLPLPTGPYAIGRVFFDWTDKARTDPFAPTRGTPREITGWIWYPAAASSQPTDEYIRGAVREALRKR